MKFDLTDECPSVHGGAGQLQQVILNVVLNGAEAMEGKAGSATVGVARRQLSRQEIVADFAGAMVPAGPYLDLAMPVMDGAEALGRIREMQPELPVLITSGYGAGAIMERTAGAPRVEYLGSLSRPMASSTPSLSSWGVPQPDRPAGRQTTPHRMCRFPALLNVSPEHEARESAGSRAQHTVRRGDAQPGRPMRAAPAAGA